MRYDTVNEAINAWCSGARQGRASTVFFEDSTLYSGGYHFPVATIHERGGRLLVLVTNRAGTPAQERHTKRAHAVAFVNHTTMFCAVPNASDRHTHDQNFLNRLDQVLKAKTAPQVRFNARDTTLTTIKLLVERYASFFGLEVPERLRAELS